MQYEDHNIGEHVNKLLQMATELERLGEKALAVECRQTATKMLDHLLFISQNNERK